MTGVLRGERPFHSFLSDTALWTLAFKLRVGLKLEHRCEAKIGATSLVLQWTS